MFTNILSAVLLSIALMCAAHADTVTASNGGACKALSDLSMKDLRL